MSNPTVKEAPAAPAPKPMGKPRWQHSPPTPGHAQPDHTQPDHETINTPHSRSTASPGDGTDAYLTGHLGTTRLIAVQGEIDLSTAPALYQRLTELVGPAPQRITLDLSRIAFIDSAGLHALDNLAEQVRRSGGSVSIGATSSAAAFLFHLADWPRWT